MIRSLLILVLLITAGIQLSYSQTGPLQTIRGTVVDEDGIGIPFAAVALFHQKDSSLLKGTTSDEQGTFALEASAGQLYTLKISFLSYTEKVIKNISLDNGPVDLRNISMENSALKLDEITVAAEKRQMEMKLDKRIFNVDKDLSNVGSNASEVLNNIPSVQVDVEGNVSLRGSQNVRILIDGKPSGLTGMSSTDALRQLQGSMIERIEVITNPSARYDAEGEVGIINIVMKKEKQKGVNGTFNMHAGYPDNYGGSYSLNYRYSKVNLFSGVGLNYRKSPGSGHTYQEFYNADSADILRSERDRTRGGVSGNFRLGADYSINEYNSITASGLYSISDNANESSILYKYETQEGERLENVERDETEQEDEQLIEGNLNYRRTFRQKDREWNTALKWILEDDMESANLEEISDQPAKKPLVQKTGNTENEENWLFQSDYVHPYNENGKFESGVKATRRIIENDFLLEERASDGIFQPVSAFDNFFIYNENIYAAYVMNGNKLGKLSWQAGLRWEYSDISTELRETNEKHHYLYQNLFPSVHFSYEMEKQNSVQISYSRRISRPHFRHLLPFYGYSDSRNFYSGNPLLQPEFSNSLELGHLKYWEKGSLLSSIYYRYRTGVVERVSVSDSAGTTRRFPINLSTQNAFGVEFNYSYNLFKWWRFNSSANFYRAITDGKFQGKRLHSDTYTWNSKTNSRFNLTKKTDLQLSFYYEAPMKTTQGKSLSIYSMNTGLSREILKGKGTLSFTVQDVFNSRKRRDVTDVTDFYSTSEFQWRARQFLVAFSYRLNRVKRKEGGEKYQEDSNYNDDGGM